MAYPAAVSNNTNILDAGQSLYGVCGLSGWEPSFFSGRHHAADPTVAEAHAARERTRKLLGCQVRTVDTPPTRRDSMILFIL